MLGGDQAGRCLENLCRAQQRADLQVRPGHAAFAGCHGFADTLFAAAIDVDDVAGIRITHHADVAARLCRAILLDIFLHLAVRPRIVCFLGLGWIGQECAGEGSRARQKADTGREGSSGSCGKLKQGMSLRAIDPVAGPARQCLAKPRKLR